MNKLLIAALVAGTAAVTGVVVSQILKNKKKSLDSELFDNEYEDCCCEDCTCGADLDVEIPAEDPEDCTEVIKEEAAEIVDDIKDAASELKEEVEDVIEEIKD